MAVQKAWFVALAMCAACVASEPVAYTIGQPLMLHPNLAPLLAAVPKQGASKSSMIPNIMTSYPFNSGGLTIPGAYGLSGGLGWGVTSGFPDPSQFGLPADYLLPKGSPEYWATHDNDYRTPLYQGSHVFLNGGLRGLRGRSLARYRWANPAMDPKMTTLHPLNHPEWFVPNIFGASQVNKQN
eukprot:c45904_g1_i1.p1 GENE.c45904_g1_i1~~c45904_g1_i1.p1  ORF type:complete len:190 (+),score=17.55 c45904_g1_i1:22-570(+)